jgi:hypothetical protein
LKRERAAPASFQQLAGRSRLRMETSEGISIDEQVSGPLNRPRIGAQSPGLGILADHRRSCEIISFSSLGAGRSSKDGKLKLDSCLSLRPWRSFIVHQRSLNLRLASCLSYSIFGIKSRHCAMYESPLSYINPDTLKSLHHRQCSHSSRSLIIRPRQRLIPYVIPCESFTWART